jgi:hypothetical protein
MANSRRQYKGEAPVRVTKRPGEPVLVRFSCRIPHRKWTTGSAQAQWPIADPLPQFTSWRAKRRARRALTGGAKLRHSCRHPFFAADQQ